MMEYGMDIHGILDRYSKRAENALDAKNSKWITIITKIIMDN